MAEFFRTRWILLFVLLVFTACKIPHLSYAYYWDESWPYAVAIKDMYKHGISLMPGTIDPELSRGHPLFFHAIGAGWMNIFGSSHISMHSFALFISVLFLIAIYEAGIRLFNTNVAIISTILVAIQVMFFVQSSFVLFEMLIAFLAFLSIYYYTVDKFFMTGLCLTALFYTKESGLIAGFILGLAALSGLFNKESSITLRLKRVSSTAVPCLLIGIFFVLQKIRLGWFIFPLYNDLIEHRWEMFWYNFKVLCMAGVFTRDNRHFYFILVLALCIFTAIRTKNYKHLILFFPALTVYYCTDDMRSGRLMPGIPFFMVLIISIIIWLYIVIKKLEYFENKRQRLFIILLCAFIFCFLCFSSLNFFTPRYLLAAMVPLLFIAAVLIDRYIHFIDMNNAIFYPAVIIILAIGFFTFKTDEGWGDANLGAFDGLAVEQKLVEYFEDNNCYDSVIGVGSFLEREHLLDAATGFLRTSKTFSKANWYIDTKTDYAVFTNIEKDNRYEQVKKDLSFTLAYRYQKGEVWGEIYKRKNAH